MFFKVEQTVQLPGPIYILSISTWCHFLLLLQYILRGNYGTFNSFFTTGVTSLTLQKLCIYF